MFTIVFLFDFEPWKLILAFVLMALATPIIIYNRRFVINKNTFELYNKSFLSNLQLENRVISPLMKGEAVFVSQIEDEEETRFTIYVKRQKNIYFFTFHEWETFDLLKSKLKETLDINLIFEKNLDYNSEEFFNVAFWGEIPRLQAKTLV